MATATSNALSDAAVRDQVAEALSIGNVGGLHALTVLLLLDIRAALGKPGLTAGEQMRRLAAAQMGDTLPIEPEAKRGRPRGR